MVSIGFHYQHWSNILNHHSIYTLHIIHIVSNKWWDTVFQVNTEGFSALRCHLRPYLLFYSQWNCLPRNQWKQKRLHTFRANGGSPTGTKYSIILFQHPPVTQSPTWSLRVQQETFTSHMALAQNHVGSYIYSIALYCYYDIIWFMILYYGVYHSINFDVGS